MARHLLVQLSDTHLTGAERLRSGAEPAANLRAALDAIARSALSPDVVLLSGDLADRAEAACYEALAAELLATKALRDAVIVAVPGNHDGRAALREHLLARLPGAPAPLGAGEDPVNSVAWHDGLRIVALDSTIPGEDAGELGPETLEFLTHELADPAPDGTIVVLHHPPLDSPIRQMAGMRLRNPEALAAAIAKSDVRLVTCGHNHHHSAGMLASVPVAVAPACAYCSDPLSEAEFRAIGGCGLLRIDVADTGVVASVAMIGAGERAAART